METIRRMVERKYGKARGIWGFDRSIVSEEDLAAIRKRDGHYLTGTARSQMKEFEAELLKEDWPRVRPEVEEGGPTGRGDLHSLPHLGPQGKREGDSQPLSSSMKAALKGLEKAILTGRLRDRNKMEWLGKIQARHPQVNDVV